jgi:hypothetical protein
MKIGVVSDTHDHLDPEVLRVFQGVDHILHAGDVGLPWIILHLEQIAPVTAVLGNTDVGLHYPETSVVELAGRKILVHHVLDLDRPNQPLHERIQRERPDVVVFGHTHRRYHQTREGRLFLNPGYAGKPRPGVARSVALLHCTPEEVRVEFRDL